MKRYLVFAGYDRYPNGGWGDFAVSCDSLDEAREKVDKAYMARDWVQVVDLETEEVIEKLP